MEKLNLRVENERKEKKINKIIEKKKGKKLF